MGNTVAASLPVYYNERHDVRAITGLWLLMVSDFGLTVS
jgi:hypothetical protein